MGRPRKISSAKKMEQLWEAYKYDCDHKVVLTHDFSAKNSEFVSRNLERAITYTLEGFCVFAGISRSALYEYYAKDERFVDMVTRMREECEVDARTKFETGQIPTQLSGLWMSRHGYTTGKSEQAASEGNSLEQFIHATKPTQEELEALYAEKDS